MTIISPFNKLPECASPINKQASFGMSNESPSPWTSWECPTLHHEEFREVVKRSSITSLTKWGKSIKHQEDPTGVKYSHMTVIGFMFKKESDRGFAQSCLFAVRCDCGRYEVRTLHRIRRKIHINELDCCDVCMPKDMKTSCA